MMRAWRHRFDPPLRYATVNRPGRWTRLSPAPLLVALSAALLAALPAFAGPVAVDPAAPLGPQIAEYLAGMEARSIGPATMSGRIASITALASDPDTVYVGTASGGLWKSVNGALTFEPLFDDQPVASIGDVAVFQAAPDLIWVGTGEGKPRNSTSVGNGVYKSLDGGRTWSHLGLEDTERIQRVILHPARPEVAWVCALGRTWGENPERGVFKTTDGGATWEKVLFVDQRTGCADLTLDPSNPMKLLAAMWDHRRWPWSFRSGGPGSGLWVSRDGGMEWTRLTPEDGLPEGDLGRIAVAVAPSDARIVYALVEAEGDKNLLLRSEDGGVKWKTVASSADQRIGNRPFYYSDLRIDPGDPDRLYSLWSLVSTSGDGGKSWEVLVPFREVHPDHHAMWIDPGDAEHLTLGNDGGVYVSRDRGRTWTFASNLPVSQFYHVRVDQETPYNVYGGLQDNGSWKGPSEVWENGGIRNHHWQEVFFGDGFDTAPDPEDPMTGYAMSQEGYLARWDLRTGQREMIRPAAPCDAEGGCEELRFNWNAGLALDPFDPATIYFGSQFVHKSSDRGDTWTTISADLTSDNPDWQKQADSGGLTPDVTGAENFTSIVTIAPSPLEPGLLWVGTDDGRLHLTRDGGASWASLEDNVRRVPAGTWIPHIEPSRHDPAEAFVVFDNHRRSDWTPYVYRTDDYGKTWRSLATSEIRGYALSIVQDPEERDLLFLGTEFGLWTSLDGGGSWFRWTHGVPTVSVIDLAIQEREHDLVLGTHGRGVFVIDDLSPLRQLSAEVATAPLHLFPAPAAIQYQVAQTGSSRFPGHGEFRGENPDYGAALSFYLNVDDLPHPEEEKERRRKEAERAEERKEKAEREAAGPASEEEEPGAAEETGAEPRAGGWGDDKGPKAEITVADASGEILRTLEVPVTLGLNRVSWDLRRDSFKEPPRQEPSFWRPRGPEVPPGTYTLTVEYGEHQASSEIEVLADPRFDFTAGEREARWQAELRSGRVQDTVTEAIERIHRTRSDIKTVQAKVKALGDETDGLEGAEETAAAEAEGAGEGETAESPYAELEKLAPQVQKGLTALEKRLWSPPDTKGIVAETTVWDKLSNARRFLGSAWDAPTPSQMGYLEQAEAALAGLLADYNAFFAHEVAELRRLVRESEIELLPEEEPLALSSED